MAVLDFLLLQITNKSNQTWPYLTYLASLTLNLPGATSPSTVLSKNIYFLHLSSLKKLPKFGWINFGTAKVHLYRCCICYVDNVLIVAAVVVHVEELYLIFCILINQLRRQNKMKSAKQGNKRSNFKRYEAVKVFTKAISIEFLT